MAKWETARWETAKWTVAKFHYADFPETSLDGKFRGSRRNGIWAKGDVTACRGCHGKSA